MTSVDFAIWRYSSMDIAYSSIGARAREREKAGESGSRKKDL